MPETRFRIRLPDGTTMACYSPSSSIREAFATGESCPVADFVERSRAALEHASQRVADKYGFGCGQAFQQIRQIEEVAARYADEPAARITVEAFE